ncbi:MAG: thiamine phosphate synthase [Bryobacteraceae bacterium]
MIAALPRFYPILDTKTVARAGLDLGDSAKALLSAGIRVLQLRHKEHFDRNLFDQARRISVMCREAGTLFVINDRADVAVLLDAALHIGQDDLPAPESRALIGPDRIIGISSHTEAQLRASNDVAVDYVAIGPLFETGSKQNPDAVVGVKELARLRPITGRPLVAIGGINRENCRSVLDAGADSVAVIGDLFPLGGTLENLRARAEEWMRLTNE